MYTSEQKPLTNSDLLSRLHRKGETSDVFQMVSQMSKMHKLDVTLHQETSTPMFIPKPPSLSMEKRTLPICTSIYRGDIKRKGIQRLREEGKESFIKHRKELSGSVSSETKSEKLCFYCEGMESKEGEFPMLSSHPDNENIKEDSAVAYIIKLREKLGWKTELSKTIFKTKWSMAEKYSSQLQDAVPRKETGEFVYCLPRCWKNAKARYDPYDLHVVTAATAIHSDLYWTVSASQICKVCMMSGKMDMDIVPVTEWLHERQNFYAIKDLKVFSHFRLWKAFTVWKLNVHRRKTNNSRAAILQQLFVADEGFQECLLYIRALCEDALNGQPGSTHGDLAIRFVKIDNQHTYNLKEFCAIQSKQCSLALANIGIIREKAISAITHTFLKAADGKGLKELFSSEDQIKPKYTMLTEWQTLLDRFFRFLTLIDCVFQEMLRDLSFSATQTLLGFLEPSYSITSTDEKKNHGLSNDEEETCFPSSESMNKCQLDSFNSDQQHTITQPDIARLLSGIRRNIDGNLDAAPLFEVNLILSNQSNTTGHGSKLVEISMPVEESHYSGKDVLLDEPTHYTAENAEDLLTEDAEDSGDDCNKGELKRCLPKCVALIPSRSEFETHIQGIVDGFEQAIGKIVSFSQETRLSKFCSQPCKDKNVGKQKINQQPWPNCELLLGMDPDYQNNVNRMNSIVCAVMEEVGIYSSQFRKFCTMVEAAESVMSRMRAVLLAELVPADYRNILAMFKGYISECKEMNIEARVRAIQVRSLDYQAHCLQHFEAVIELINSTLPVRAHARNIQLLEVIHNALRKLNKDLRGVEEFVEHLTFLGQISSEVPSLEREYSTIMQLYSIANEYSIAISPEETAHYQSLIPSFQQLKSAILFYEAKKDENIVRFSGDLDKYISQLHLELIEFKVKVRNPLLLQGDIFPRKALEIIRTLLEEFEVLANKARCYSSYQERFGSSVTHMKAQLLDELLSQKNMKGVITSETINAELSETENDLNLRKLLWESKEEWVKLSTEWKHTAFELLNVDVIQRDVNRFNHTLFILEKGLPANEVVARLRESVMDFRQNLPIVVALSNPCLKPRHWDTIQFTTGRSIHKEKNFTLENLLELKIFHHKDKIIETSTTATNEATLEGMLNKVISLWNRTEFKLTPHKSELSEILIVACAEEIVSQIEESQVIISTVKGSRYVAPIKNTVDELDRKLSLFLRTMEELMICQRNWLYLEQIFLASDIQRQLPAEARIFFQVDSSWKEIMENIKDRPSALRAAIAPGLLEVLQNNNAHLEKILKCLEDFLEIKRKVFPRFYFLSNEDLLAILSESKNPDVVQPHLVKCFENIRHLDITFPIKSPPVVVKIRSAEGETIHMPNNIRIRGPVEQWLGNVESSMFDIVKKLVKLGVMDWGQSEFKKWMLSHTGQVVLLVSQIMFNKECVRSFHSEDPEKELRLVHENLIQHLGQLADMAFDIPLLHQKTTLEALLTLYVHCRDVLTELIKKKVFKSDDFEWTRQLRYQWNENNNTCYAVQGNATFHYGYEYLGCSSRLVITPLTDRCWLTLTGALHLHLGGSPAGPAGTGKTETVKDLAKALGKHCVVFNCSEGLDYKMMGKFFSGMAQSGAWCCFDEFNRIDIEVLSVIASQIHAIKTAKDSQVMRFVFEGREMRLNMSCGVFITMNPGYKGRVALPDNLKSLFRPVAMMVPDYQLIAEIMLFSEGFKAAKSLSGKLVNLYQLASKQLSQQNHYDFGMRAIKTVLVMAGQKKQDLELGGKHMRLSPAEESLIVIRALKEANLPKFLAEDVPLFENIMADLFPGVVIEKADTKRLEKAISMASNELGLQPWETQVEKVIQFHNQIVARHGVMLVGPAGGGKTTVRRILEKALMYLPSLPAEKNSSQNILKKGKVETFTINPKCVTLGELYGEVNPNTMEWTDGLLALAVRTVSQQRSKVYAKEKPQETINRPTSASSANQADGNSLGNDITKSTYLAENEEYLEKHQDLAQHHSRAISIHDWNWIVLDGPVDTVWVENLNTVLDDTRTLCLANSERIQLPQGMRIIFEVDSLSQASPATVSRCAMVYMDPVDLGWKPFVKTWLNQISAKVPHSGVKYLENLFTMSVPEGLKFIHKHRKMQPFPVQELGVVMTLCKILEAFIDFMSRNGGFGHIKEVIPEEQLPVSPNMLPPREVGTPDRSNTASLSVSSITRRDQKWFLEKYPEKLSPLLGKLYVFAFTWAFGGVLKREDEHEGDALIGIKVRDETLVNLTNDFSNFVHDMFEGDQRFGIQMPLGQDSVFSYFVDLQTGNFVPWHYLVPSTDSLIQRGSLLHADFSLSDTLKASDSGGGALHEFIPTVDSVRYSFLTSLLLLHKQPVLITGESGVGKSALIQNMFQRIRKPGGLAGNAGTVLGDVFLFNESRKISLMHSINSLTAGSVRDDSLSGTAEDFDGSLIGAEGWISAREQGYLRTSQLIVSTVQLGAHTTSARLQAQIQNNLMKKSRGTLGAPKHKKVAVFIDDLNMPIPEQYGAQPPLEFLRQFLDLGGFYDTQTLTWKNVRDLSLLAACAPPGGGRNEISPRLLKHFCLFVLPHPSVHALQHIFQVPLGSFLQSNNFLAEIQKCRDLLTSSAIAIYLKMCSSMLPTPAKCHYTFNLRDLFKVLQGLLQANESVMVTKDSAALLLLHEATRVFHDRLTQPTDRAQFFQFLSDELHNYFKISWPKEKLMQDAVQFADFLDTSKTKIYRPVSNHKKLISRLEEYRIKMKMSSANPSNTYIFFDEAVQHIIRAARVFRQPGGHMMLVGLDGTGKVTSASMASYIAECELYRLSITQSYSHDDFREELKKVFKKTGLLGKNTVFLLTGADIVQDSFLEDLNCLLNSGEVPDLFDKEELDGLFVEFQSAAPELAQSQSPQSLLSFFLQRVQCKLHIVLALSPAGNTFREYCRSHPSLVNCCTIDWYDEWPEEALLNVAKSYTLQEDMLQNNQELRDSVSQMCVNIHKSVSQRTERYLRETRRHYYVTPQNYLGFIDTFSKILHSKKQTVLTDRFRFFTGLSKLLGAADSIEAMQQELVALGPQIEHKTQEIETLIAKAQKDSVVVEQVRAIVAQEEEVMAAETKIVQDYAEQAVQELNDVLPALQEAVSALDALDKGDISEVKVYTHPPFLVLTVMNAVCVLLQKKPDWPTAKLLLADPGFLKRLVSLDKDCIPEKAFLKLKKFSKTPDFNPQKVGMVSSACRSLCQWVLALEHYHDVKKMVTPKQKHVAEAQEALGLAQERLKHKQRSLAMVEEHLQLIQKQYNESVSEKELMAHRKKLTTERLQRASVLISALAEEKIRWKESVDRLDLAMEGIIGDTLVSAAFIAYCGAFTSEYREKLVEEWLEDCRTYKIPLSGDYSIIRAMASENEVRQWQNEGLPLDPYSTENAILVKNSHRWPLFIDPHGQACKWICQMEGTKLRQVRASDDNYLQIMENAMRLGEAVLLQDVAEKLDPSLKPILGKEIFRRAGQDFIKIGDSEIEYDQNFRLYMTTQAPHAHFLPAVCIMVTMINFTVTFKGLQNQLLSSVVTHEQPHLEEQRCQLLESIASDACTLRELEEKSLSLLQKTQGHLLDDEDLIDNLKKSTMKSKDVQKRIEDSAKTEATIEAARGTYLPVAKRGAILYFVVADLIHLNYMYQFSLQWFHQIFVESMEAAGCSPAPTSLGSSAGTIRPQSKQRSTDRQTGPNEELNIDNDRRKNHINNIIDTLTENIYKIVSCALFTEHQLCFSFTLTVNIMRNSSGSNSREPSGDSLGFVPSADWEFFLHSRLLADTMGSEADSQATEMRDEEPVCHIPGWLSQSTWRQCQYLASHMEPFALLCESLSSNTQQWRSFQSSGNLYEFLSDSFLPPALQSQRDGAQSTNTEEMPSEPIIFKWEELSAFHKLILIKVLRPECLIRAIREFIAEKMGMKYLQSGRVNLKETLEESTASRPLIFILSSGIDPAGQLERLALETRGSTLHLDMISLGRGQGAKAEELIHNAHRLKGRWVFLQNCHLAASFMPKLCKIVEKLAQQNSMTDPQFRLWLSSKPDPSFPIPILQRGFKMAVEPPQGLKGKLLQTFDNNGTGMITEKIFERDDRGPSWKKLLFSLCFFNAIVNERRKYGALGWNILYEFTPSDLEVSVQMLGMFMEGHNEVPWQAVHYLTGEVVYGGRVTDSWDRRCLLSILGNFYSPAVLQENYSFSSDNVYRSLPVGATLEECRAHLESFPDTDSPEVFGMHPNAEISSLQSQAQLLLDTVVSMESRIGVGHAAHRGEEHQEVTLLQIISNIRNVLPQTVEGKPFQDRASQGTDTNTTLSLLFSDPRWETLVKTTKGYDPLINSALVIVLRQETDRFNQLLSVIHGSLHALQQAITGEIILTKQLEEVQSCLVNLKVPALWQQHSYESCKLLGSWVDDLVQRVKFFATWANRVVRSVMERFPQLPTKFINSRPNSSQPAKSPDPTSPAGTEQPTSFWLSAFFFPQGFLTAVLQNHARMKQLSVDSLTFQHRVQHSPSLEANINHNIIETAFSGCSALEEGISVFGLFLDGARWNGDSQCLEEAGHLCRFDLLPPIHFIPQTIEDHKENGSDAENKWYSYQCPIYRTSQRAGTLSSTGLCSNFVTAVSLPTLLHPDHWIRRGVALLCQTNE
ncbi:dynein heavy chain 14, axonemal [Xenopus laevis]|uniref:Dynein heavy chain 14, axonemal n=2 Tax=Xenopus laevis TaxID=8355 RepID=A0A1L8G673_XENLA|nr:dynein heavy chain 14, axonemal [Xenopus laevis]OCT79469.1 hypothetical protein XELAEV_18026279mg [Xenopus laevis]